MLSGLRRKRLASGVLRRAYSALVLLALSHTALAQLPPLYLRIQPPTAAELEVAGAVSAVQRLTYRPGYYMGEPVWDLHEGSVTRIDSAGGLLSTTEFDGTGRTTAETSYELDERGRVTRLVRLPQRGNLTQNAYRYAGDWLVGVYEFVGPVDYQLVYDENLRISQVVVIHGGGSQNVWLYEHDPSGLLVRETAPTGDVVEFEFSPSGALLARRTSTEQRIHAMTPNERGGLSPTTFYRTVESETRVVRDDWGRVIQRINNGSTTRYVYVGEGLAWTERYQINDKGEEEELVVRSFEYH
jgi:YD repeat-containing protein